MSARIHHEGIIDSIEKDRVRVRILQCPACSVCNVSSSCGIAESQEKLIDVYCADTGIFQVGTVVTVSTTGNVAIRAVLWAFGVPLVMMVLILFMVLRLTGNEGVAALSSLLVLIPYYGLLFILRYHMRRQITFTIE